MIETWTEYAKYRTASVLDDLSIHKVQLSRKLMTTCVTLKTKITNNK